MNIAGGELWKKGVTGRRWRQGKGREMKGRGGETGGSVGYPFESWKLIQRADMLTDGQTALCVSLYCPAIQPHYTVRTFNSLWKHLLYFLIGQSLENRHNITTEYTHSLYSPLSVMLIWWIRLRHFLLFFLRILIQNYLFYISDFTAYFHYCSSQCVLLLSLFMHI